MKAVTIRIEDDLAKYYSDNYSSLTAGFTIAAEGFLILRTRALKSLKGVFSRKEIIAVAGSYNGSMRQEQYMCLPFFIAHIEDSEIYENISQQYGIDLDNLLAKIKTLSDAQSYFLLDRIFCFWDNESGQEDALQKLVDEFV
jgi:hypothetical protein